MTVIEHLMQSDPSVARMTQKYLLGENPDYVEDGWISLFLERFDSNKNTWGNGIYGPKWISTFYTLRDLVSLEIDPEHPIFQKGLDTLEKNMWSDKWNEDDVCVVAMLVSLMTYGKRDAMLVNAMVDYLVDTQLKDGGWNCAIRYESTDNSSINTTLSVLEAYRDYEKYGYTKHLKIIHNQLKSGQDYLLKRQLMFRLENGDLIISYIKDFHFPTRWKYDVLRALCYFASVDYKKVPELSAALSLLNEKFKRGYLLKGPTYTGLHHFKMETGKFGAMNTLRGLMVLKAFEPEKYDEITNTEVRGQ